MAYDEAAAGKGRFAAGNALPGRGLRNWGRGAANGRSRATDGPGHWNRLRRAVPGVGPLGRGTAWIGCRVQVRNGDWTSGALCLRPCFWTLLADPPDRT